MASTMADNRDNIKLKSSTKPSRFRVRIVGKIRGFSDQESRLCPNPWIVVRKSHEDASQRVSISFGDQSTSSRKDAYELNYCYGQDEDNSLIYSREIEPFISEVFDGRDMSILAYGARGSGKTCTIQGSEEKPGLAVMAMAEILSKAKGTGNLVSLSMFEVCHDQVYDILDVKCPKIQVLEAQGKINLKGLSKVSVRSVQEFYDIYFSRSSSNKSGSNVPLEPPKRSHRGLTVYISSTDDDKNRKLVGKMNFVDLAGYEDSRRTSKDGTNIVESTRTNKSLYALLNVVHALNVNESRVPYRESKLTHMLKESLGGKSRVLMLTCMNPSFCQDTIHTVSLASRSCQSNPQELMDSKMGSKSASKLNLSSPRGRKPPFFSAKQQFGCSLQLSKKEGDSFSRGRKLLDASKATSEQPKSPLPDDSACKSKLLPSTPSVKTLLPSTPSANTSVPEENQDTIEVPTLDSIEALTLFPSEIKDVPSNNKFSEVTPMDVSSNNQFSEVTPLDVSSNNKAPEVTPSAVKNIKDMTLYQDETTVGTTGKENISLLMYGNGSPPLSEKIRKISDNLKALCSSTPLTLRKPNEIDPSSVSRLECDVLEPKTPVIERNVKLNDEFAIVKYNSPCSSVNQRSSCMKSTLVEDYLNCLNTASKEELKGLKGIGEKRATYILELREESPQPFKRLEDLENIGLSAKQIKGIMKKVAGDLFN